MISDQFGLVIDLLGAALLIAVIFYVVRLNRNLTVLKASKAELDGLVTAFNDSTNRAEASVARLKASATETATALQAGVDKAQELRDDLAFMTSRADELATRLEAAIAGARGAPQSSSQAARNTAEPKPKMGNENSADTATQDERGKSKAELLRALQGMR